MEGPLSTGPTPSTLYTKKVYYQNIFHDTFTLSMENRDSIMFQNEQICHTLRSRLHEIPTIITTFSPGLKNNDKLKLSLTKKSRNNTYVWIPGKLSEINFNVSLLSNQWKNVLKV